MTREEAIKILMTAAVWDDDEREALDVLIPELRESDNDRVRQALCDIMRDMPYMETELRAHGLTVEQAIAYLEKQKEQKPVEPSDEELQRHQDELYDFQVFAAKQAKEHHISHVHDFEWHNFCEGLLSYFNEKQKPAEWSEEDEKKITFLGRLIRYNVPDGQYGWVDGRKGGFVTKSEAISMLKSLRSSWKPSEEQMIALKRSISYLSEYGQNDDDLILCSLYKDLQKRYGTC